MLVVSKMGIIQPQRVKTLTQLQLNKIPDDARYYRNEYLYIRGINKTCGEFVKKLGEEEIFKSPQADRLIRQINVSSLITMFVTRLNFQLV